MPKLWSETIGEHRRAVRDAIVESTWLLVEERGLLAVTMSEIADRSGIGRATLYKYFPDVEAILLAGHQRHVADHLEELNKLREGAGSPGDRLEAVLRAYAFIAYHRERHSTPELGALLHRGEDVSRAQQQLVDLFRDLLVQTVAAGQSRDDVAPDELANYCLHALSAASTVASAGAVERLVEVTLAGLRPLPA